MLHLLTPADFIWEEDVKFTTAAPEDHREAGVFVKIDASATSEAWRSYVKMDVADVYDETCAILTTPTGRPDTGQGIVSGNPSYSVTGNTESATVISNLKGLKIVTDNIANAGVLTIGAELTVVGGILEAAGTNPVVATFMGPAEPRYGIDNAFVVKF